MKRKFIAGVLVLLTALILVASIPLISIKPTPTIQSGTAQFVLSSWDYPDEYGQGINMIKFYENSTGAWVAAPYYQDGLPYYSLHSYDDYSLNWSGAVAMKLRIYSILNTTLTGAIDEADGQNYQRHSVIVTSVGETIFSQQNFTYYDVTPWEDIPQYEYEVVLNFLPADGEIYTVVVNYEIFY